MFATARLTVTVPILRFCEDKNTRQPVDLLCGRATTSHEDENTGGMVRTNLANPLLMNAISGQCPSPEEATLQHLVPVSLST